MKKSVFQIIMLALLLIMGCTKDDLITTEQDLFSAEKNNLSAIGEKRGDGGANGWNFVEFYGTSTDTTSLKICLLDSITGVPIDCGRKLLANGYFSGNLPGYGKINSSYSKYTIAFREPYYETFPLYNDPEYYASYDDPTIPARFEEYQYNIEIIGKVGTSNRDYFNIKITAVIRPMVPDSTGDIIKGSWISASDIEFTPGEGKLANYSDANFGCGTTLIDGTNFQGINLDTGEISLVLNNIHF